MKYCYVEYAYMYPFNGGKSNKSHLKMKLLIKIPAILKKMLTSLIMRVIVVKNKFKE